MRKPKDFYVCRYCGYVLPKEDATISGYDSEYVMFIVLAGKEIFLI